MANPVLRESAFARDDNLSNMAMQHAMTTNGTLAKTLILAVLMTITFAYTWHLQMSGFADKASLLTMVGAIGGFIMAMVICFAPKNQNLMFTTPVYAMLEGLFLGSASAQFEVVYPGIVFQAVVGTLGTIFGMYLLYSSKIIKNMDMFRKIVFISTFAVCGIYVVQIILSFFHASIPGIFSNGLIGIGFSVLVVAIAAFNLVVDFDFIDRFSGNAPDYMEWYGGFSLMVTIVWLYIEILKLLAKFSSRR